MPSPAIKICGLTTPDALEAAIGARADYVGFNFYAPSPRSLRLKEAAELAPRAAGRITRVGVFVDAEDAVIADAIEAAGLEVLQLHGAETPQRVAEVKIRFGLPAWKVLPIAAGRDVGLATAYTDAADFILFDAKTPKGALPGGMGLAFDWSLLALYRGATPWGLAGGLTPDNVAEAIRITRAPLVDTSSGVESAPGVKDAGRIAAFCAAVRGA
ncbi:MAG: phosphoribosylanthranilate isomerase [Proteobacteria bacterium]|nr:phosphoribosylanthranilate isomerase [Pseudomonadota bacterium]